MGKADRRAVLQLTMALALAPVASAVRAAGTGPARLIAPPDAPMRFSREVLRELTGGVSIRAQREFRVRFRQYADGFIVDGEQVAVEVTMPPSLAKFAEIERTREPRMFPLALDPFGRVHRSGGKPVRDDAVGRAVAEAERQIAQQPIAAYEKADLRLFINHVHQTGTAITSQFPVDLFAPASPTSNAEREIALPGGAAGKVITRFASTCCDRTGLMLTASREIATIAGGERRMTIERWQLQPETAG